MKYSEKFIERFRKRATFTTGDAKRFLVSLGASCGYASVFLSNAVKRGTVKRLAHGVYSFQSEPDSSLAEAAFSPAYHGLQDALSIHGLWEQETIPVLVTPRRVKQGVRCIAGGKILVRRIARKMFFGFESVRVHGGESWTRVSDVEKTLIDFVYFKAPLGGEALTEIAGRLNEKKLGEYLARSPAWVARRVRKLLSRRK
ncbi:MAG: type IV toxin-antitoxin system AbiEi family antitoxin domain-containing protein [Candidatus Micrarchaeota archaeon]